MKTAIKKAIEIEKMTNRIKSSLKKAYTVNTDIGVKMSNAERFMYDELEKVYVRLCELKSEADYM